MSYDYAKLKGLIRESGKTYRDLSRDTGIPISTLNDKVNGRTEFKASEIAKLSSVLGITNLQDYFFAPEVRQSEHQISKERRKQ